MFEVFYDGVLIIVNVSILNFILLQFTNLMHQKRVSLLQLLNPLTKFLDFLFLFLCHPAKLQGFVLKPLSSGLKFIECLILEVV